MKGKKKVKEPAGMNIPEIFAALAMLEKERGIPQTFICLLYTSPANPPSCGDF